MKILMVCLGNICRSPLAQGVMEDLASKSNLDWEIASAGTSSFHVGEKPDPRSVEIAAKNGIDISHQRSQLLKVEDLDYYDYILVMDKSNYKDAISLSTSEEQKEKIQLFLELGESEIIEVPDPYYTKGFDYVFDLINEACQKISLKISKQDAF